MAPIGLTFGILGDAACKGLRIKYTSGSFYILGSLWFLAFGLLYVFIALSKEQRRKKDAESASAAKSDFLATMSHEIRTPINAVLGMNEMIIRDANEENIRDYAFNVAEAGKSLLSLVNDILDFSKIESGKMDIVCVEYQLRYLLNDLILMAKTRIDQKKLQLILDIDEDIPSKYFGDEVRIKQVVTNLLTNAIKYTEEGSITFSVKNQGIEDDQILLLFSVKDTGIGIKEEDLGILLSSSFVRLDQTRNRNIEGTGLGLSITRQLLTLMESNLEVKSEYGHGSDFYFVIRQRVIDNSPMGSVQEKTEKRSKRRKNTFTCPDVRMLAVDDTKTNLMVIKGLLKPYGAKVETCESGEKCLELCRSNKYDIIFMDHMMPHMDGIEALNKLKENNSIDEKTKVVALTANAISGAEELYRESGFDDYLTKPIDSTELDSCIKVNIQEEYIISLSEAE